jgi:pentose-5-phosphate-3-epimerase
VVLLCRPSQGQSLVQAACALGLPVGVDGGVTHANLDQISASGARYAVVGRAITPASAAP